jgi:hypothetical protein
VVSEPTRPPDPTPTTLRPSSQPQSNAPAHPAHQVWAEHVQWAEPRWRRSETILSHANPTQYADLASQFADRLAAVTPETPPGHLQELLHEERQLIDHLQRRYDGIPELQKVLGEMLADVERVESQITTVVESPDPRERSARVGDAVDRH